MGRGEGRWLGIRAKTGQRPLLLLRAKHRCVHWSEHDRRLETGSAERQPLLLRIWRSVSHEIIPPPVLARHSRYSAQEKMRLAALAALVAVAAADVPTVKICNHDGSCFTTPVVHSGR